MDFDIISGGVKKAFDTFVQNIVAYIVGLLIAFIGSILIVTIAPLFYSLYCMVLKGTRGENVEIKDIFYGFSSGSIFVRSWIGFIVYGLLISIISILLNLVAIVVPSLALLISLISMLVSLIISIFLFYTIFIYVMTPSESIIYALKESFGIGKSNIVMVFLTIIISGILSILVVTAPLGMLFSAYVLKGLKPEIKDDSGI